jgi:hypothetical protein
LKFWKILKSVQFKKIETFRTSDKHTLFYFSINKNFWIFLNLNFSSFSKKDYNIELWEELLSENAFG